MILFQACYLQTVSQAMTSSGAITYSTLTALVRYVYIRSSLVQEIQYIIKRDSFIVKSVVFGESLLVFHFGTFYWHLIRPEVPMAPFVQYKACVDPWSQSVIPIWQVAPFSQIFFHLFNFINIICNIWLYKYLQYNTRNNSALGPLDKKADRKRNLYPAWIGIFTLFACVFCYIFYIITYSFPSHILDNSTKAFMNALLSDSIFCIITPGIIMWGSQTGKRRIQKIKNKMKQAW